MTISQLQRDGKPPALRYGDKVLIRDGSKLDGCVGIVSKIKDGEVQVLLDREVFWMVAEHWLELFTGSPSPATGPSQALEFGTE